MNCLAMIALILSGCALAQTASPEVAPDATPTPTAESAPAAPPAPAPVQVSPQVEERAEALMEMVPEEASTEKSRLLNLSARIDASFNAGNPVQQGFQIPSIRLSVFGEVGDHIDYRLALGQTREFSTVMLPQVMPVEAFIRVATGGLSWRMGMFTPSFNPWWSPDLSDLEYPDYFESHRAVFLSRDIGAEVAFEEKPSGGLKAGGGAFNGNGILGMNSNNAKALTAFLSYAFFLGDTKITLGGSGYTLLQSSSGNVNYKSNQVAAAFISLDFPSLGVFLGGDFFVGKFEDSTRKILPRGETATVIVRVLQDVKLFARGEILRSPPSGALNPEKHFQIGPMLIFNESLKAFVLYDYFDSGSSSISNSFQVRVRLTI